jgi:chemotaxis signal transduction protein
MSGGADDLSLAFLGQGPIFDAMLDERARELAQAPQPEPAAGTVVRVLTMSGAAGRWALPLDAVARVEPLARCLPLPGQPPVLLGLALLAGQRRLVADLDALAGGGAPRAPERAGHAVLLREGASGGLHLALAVDRAEAVMDVPRIAAGQRLADGSVLLNPSRLVAALMRGGDA